MPGSEYDISGYGAMIGDRVRTPAYVEALRRSVRPGSVVLDLGTGTGAFALLACRLGARKVIAIEPGDVIEVAREMASANGFTDRIEFIHEISLNARPSERADVIISDLRGALPLHTQHIPSIVDARRRLLVPGGVLIPQRDRIWATPVEEASCYKDNVDVWREGLPEIEMTLARRLATNTWWKANFEPGQLLAPPACWATLDYMRIEDANVGGELEWTVSRRGTAHGLGLWFEATLLDDISFSNEPGKPRLVYSNAFFPFSEPLAVEPGDRISVSLRANLVGAGYVWRWQTALHPGRRSKGAAFSQSTLHGVVLTPAQLRRSLVTHVPALTERGRVDQLVLSRMAEGVTLADIADEIARKFRTRFPTRTAALDHVAALSQRYSA